MSTLLQDLRQALKTLAKSPGFTAVAALVQVTRSETNAACGSRIVRLRDGWMVNEKGMALQPQDQPLAAARA